MTGYRVDILCCLVGKRLCILFAVLLGWWNGGYVGCCFFQAEEGIRVAQESRCLGDVCVTVFVFVVVVVVVVVVCGCGCGCGGGGGGGGWLSLLGICRCRRTSLCSSRLPA